MSGLDDAPSQAERTALAWSRTVIALAAVLALTAVHGQREHAPIWVVAGELAVAAILLVSVSPITRRVWKRASAALSGTTDAARPAIMAVPALAVVLLTAAALIIIILNDWSPS